MAARECELPADCAGSVGHADVVATATATFSIEKNGSPVGTVVFGTVDNEPTFTTSGGLPVTFLAGDILTLITPTPQDATLAEVAITLALTRAV